MRRERLDPALLLDMLNAAQAVIQYVAGRSREDFERDQMFRDAVERRVEIIGEAARGISDPFRDAHPEIPWRKIQATRHILAHDYDDVDHDIIWRVATLHIPELIELLKPLIPAIPNTPSPSSPVPQTQNPPNRPGSTE